MRLGDFVVMRYGVLIGYSNGRRIVSVATRRHTLAQALEAAAGHQRGTPAAAFWVQRVGQKAYRSAGAQRASTRQREKPE